jgi:hypothetical protein
MPRLSSSAQDRWQSWLSVNPCPLDAPGEPTINLWIYDAALACRRSGVSQYRAVTLIKDAMTRNPKGPREAERAVERAYKAGFNGNLSPRAKAPAFDVDLLARRASRIPFEVSDDYLAETSPECVLGITPAQYLDTVFSEGEKVTVIHPMNASTGTGFIYAVGDRTDADLLPDYINRNKDGVHYVNGPVTGEPDEVGSIRSENCLTSFRHCVIESDIAKQYRDLWLAALAQMQLPIKAIYESGSNPPSIHALVDVGATSKADYERIVTNGLKPLLGAISQ